MKTGRESLRCVPHMASFISGTMMVWPFIISECIFPSIKISRIRRFLFYLKFHHTIIAYRFNNLHTILPLLPPANCSHVQTKKD